MIDKIKSEVERRKAKAELARLEAEGVSSLTYNMHLAEENLCMFLLSFIESLEKEQDAPKIKGWVARDYDSEIFFHCKKPQKFHEEGIAYWANGGYRFMIPQSMQAAFRELYTSDEPIEVELTLSRVIK